MSLQSLNAWNDLGRVIHDQVSTVLSRLVTPGESTWGVANTLSALGYRGRAGDSCACPVARYIHHELVVNAVYVGAQYITVNDTADRSFTVRTPALISSFVFEFDCGFYPDLIEGDHSSEQEISH